MSLCIFLSTLQKLFYLNAAIVLHPFRFPTHSKASCFILKQLISSHYTNQPKFTDSKGQNKSLAHWIVLDCHWDQVCITRASCHFLGLKRVLYLGTVLFVICTMSLANVKYPKKMPFTFIYKQYRIKLHVLLYIVYAYISCRTLYIIWLNAYTVFFKLYSNSLFFVGSLLYTVGLGKL